MYDMKYNIQVDSDMHLCAGPIMAGGKGTCIVSKHVNKDTIKRAELNVSELILYVYKCILICTILPYILVRVSPEI